MSAAARSAPDLEQLALYGRLVKMLEHELELAGQGRVTELGAAIEQRSRYLRSLPAPADSDTEQLLLRAQALHGRVSIETQRLAEAITGRREARRLARRMARTYVAAPSPRSYSTSA